MRGDPSLPGAEPGVTEIFKVYHLAVANTGGVKGLEIVQPCQPNGGVTCYSWLVPYKELVKKA